ncbi:MAG: hypothetical protein H0U76_15755 [Ktedonobacteraceae bacterium]|nr:hypothetical protein [Ktedonobacteraceae bacterium]
MQQNPLRLFPLRRLLFPYSGEEPLTRAQGARVIVTWAIFFPAVLMVGTLPFVLFVKNAPLQGIVLLLLLIFLAGVAVFGGLAWFVVFTINRSARIYQAQRARWSTTTTSSISNNNSSGGRYGS